MRLDHIITYNFKYVSNVVKIHENGIIREYNGVKLINSLNSTLYQFVFRLRIQYTGCAYTPGQFHISVKLNSHFPCKHDRFLSQIDNVSCGNKAHLLCINIYFNLISTFLAIKSNSTLTYRSANNTVCVSGEETTNPLLCELFLIISINPPELKRVKAVVNRVRPPAIRPRLCNIR